MFVSGGGVFVCISVCLRVCSLLCICVHVSLLLHVLTSWPASLLPHIEAPGAFGVASSFYKGSERSTLRSSVLSSK